MILIIILIVFRGKKVERSLGENSDLGALAIHVTLHVLFENTILIILNYLK